MELSEQSRASGPLSAAPLRKAKPGGVLYTRPAEIEARLNELATLPREELLKQCEDKDRDESAYVPSECIVHFVRACRGDERSSYFERLYKVLAYRVHQRLPKAESLDGKMQSLALEDIRDRAFGRFARLLAEDRNGYSEQLDYYEVRFNGAVANLRRDAQEKTWREVNRASPLEIDHESGEFSGDAERAGGSFNPFDPENLKLADYRLRLEAAIDALTPDHQKILEMIRLEIPIDSQDPNILTISKALGKSEKTIRTYRDQAYASIRAHRADGGRP